MNNIKNLEVFNLETIDGKLMAHISYQDTDRLIDKDEVNNGYRSEIIPVNLRSVQFSVRGNYLVNQSKKEEFINTKTYE